MNYGELGLGEVCEFIMGQAPNSKTYNNVGNGAIFYRVSDFNEKIPYSETFTTNPLVFGKETDIFLCIVGATCGKVNFGKNGAITRSIAALRPNNKVLKEYLFYYLKSNYEKFNNASEGSAQPILNKTKLQSFKIRTPSIQEQKQIVETLDKTLEKIDKAIANIERNIDNAEELFKSYLQNIFENKGDDWKLVPLDQVCEISGGSQPPKDNFIYEPREGYVRLVQVRDYRTDKYITYIPRNKAKKFCKADDIMIGRYGPPIFGIFSGIEGAYNVALMKAIPNESKINKEYLRWFLKTPNIIKFVEKTSKRAAGQDGVRKERLYEYNIPISAFPEQKKIVETLGKLSLEIKKLESIYTQKIADLKELKKSILEKAFKGELTSAA